MSKCGFNVDKDCIETKCHKCKLNPMYQQGRAAALNIDMDKPMHFTDEQKAWIKNYIIINAKRQRADVIDEYKLKLLNAQSDLVTDIHKAKVWVEFKRQASDIAEQLKEQTE